ASYYADPDREMAESRKAEYDRCIEARSRRIPLQHITGEQAFMGLTFRVNGDVLIPRQDTETLVETALDLLNCGKSTNRTEERIVRLLDMCTGSGCILLSMLHYAKCRTEGIGSDISAKALNVASENARRLGMTAGFIESDLFEKIEGKFT